MLVVTSPSPDTLLDLRALTAPAGPLPGSLRIVAVFPADDGERHEAAAALAGRIAGLEVRKLECLVGPDAVFRPNDCTPAFTRLAAQAAGFLFPGGADLPPALYGETTRLTTEVRTPARHRFEVSFLAHLLGRGGDGAAPLDVGLLKERPRTPVLAICLGMQTLNVARGGTLIQDIPSQVYGLQDYESITAQDRETWHRNPERFLAPDVPAKRYSVHAIRTSGEWPFPLPDGRIQVASSHHQGIARLGSGLAEAAHSLDGRVIEALTLPGMPGVLGVQFHPEYRNIRDATRRRGAPRTSGLDTPASQDFHQALWQWFGQGLVTQDSSGQS